MAHDYAHIAGNDDRFGNTLEHFITDLAGADHSHQIVSGEDAIVGRVDAKIGVRDRRDRLEIDRSDRIALARIGFEHGTFVSCTRD